MYHEHVDERADDTVATQPDIYQPSSHVMSSPSMVAATSALTWMVVRFHAVVAARPGGVGIAPRLPWFQCMRSTIESSVFGTPHGLTEASVYAVTNARPVDQLNLQWQRLLSSSPDPDHRLWSPLDPAKSKPSFTNWQQRHNPA
jgi:hypothetical protein